MSRPTTKIETEHGHEVVLYEYATGREYREIQNKVYESMEVDMGSTGKPKIKNMDMTKQQESTDRAIELLVVSVDNDESGVLDKVLDLPQEDYQEVEEKIDELTNKKNENQSNEPNDSTETTE